DCEMAIVVVTTRAARQRHKRPIELDCSATSCSIKSVYGFNSSPLERWTSMKKLLFGCVAFVAVAAKAASAADLPPAPAPVPYYKAPAMEPAYDWTGFYIGGHFTYSWSNSTGQTTNLANGHVSAPNSTDTSAAHGGAQIGYDYMLPSRVVIGILADV